MRPLPLACSLFLIFWGWYAATALPSVAPVDGGELTLAAAELGIAHPPGFPVYVASAHALTHLPLGDLGHRVNLVSALFGALTVALLFRLIHLLGAGGTSRFPGPALLVAALYGVSRTPWAVATTAEVYSFTTALCVGALLAAAHRTSRGEAASALLIGLALSAHLVIALVCLPAAVVLAGWRSGRPRRWRRTPFFLLLGALPPVTTLTVRAAAGPVLAWGRPVDVHRLRAHITAWQYRTHLFEAPLGETLEQVWIGLRRWGMEASGLWPLLLVATLFLIPRIRPRAPLLAAALLGGLSLSYTAVYQIAEDREAYLLPAFLGSALLVGWVGERWLAGAKGRRARGPIAAGLLLAVVAVSAVNLAENGRRRDQLPRDAARAVLDSATSGALILTSDWQFYAPTLYLRWVEGYRADLALVDVNLLRYSWYPDLLRAESAPLIRAVRERLVAFQDQQRLFEADLPYDPNMIQKRFEELLEAMQSAILEGGGDVYFTPLTERFVLGDLPLVGEGFLLRRGSLPARMPRAVSASPLRGLHLRRSSRDALETKVLPSLARALASTAGALAMESRWDEAIRTAHRAVEVRPADTRLRELLADCLLQAGRVEEARREYRRILELGPRDPRLVRKLRSTEDGTIRPGEPSTGAGQSR